MKRIPFILMLACLATGAAQTATAQDPPTSPAGPALVADPPGLPVPIGSRIRISTRDDNETTGTLVSWSERAAMIEPEKGKEALEIPNEAIASLDRSVKREPLTKRWAIIGGLIGAAAPAILFGAVWQSCGNCQGNSLEGAVAGLVVLGRFTIPIGALLGAALGKGRLTDRWEKVNLGKDTRAQLKVGIVPDTRGGVSGGVTLSWR